MDRPTSPAALFLGGPFTSLAAARDLANRGVSVSVVDDELCVCQFSRDVRHFWRCPPAGHEEQLIDFLVDLAVRQGQAGAVLFPSSDEGVRIFAQQRGRLSQYYTVTTPPWEVTRFLYDKRLTHQLALERYVPVPATFAPGSRQELEALDLEFPVVLKPAITTRCMAATKKKAFRADNREQLLNLYDAVVGIIGADEILVQELIPGGAKVLFSFGGLFRDGRAVAGVTAHRSRQHPMEFGRASTFVELVDVPQLRALATRLLEGIGYSGLAEVEFMYDDRHGRYELLEVNPRIWGWHSIAIHAGLDLPYLAYAAAIGRPAVPGAARLTAKWVRPATDIPAAALEILAGRLSIGRYLATLRGDVDFAPFSRHDPLPFVADFVLIPYYMKHRGF